MRHIWVEALVLAMLAAVPAAAQDTTRYDLLITGGTVVDGSGAPRFTADVAVRNGRIVAVSPGRLPRARARRVIDASGRVVAPGFIDLHAHLEGLLQMPDAGSHVRMGVTTALGGPDGGSPWPIGEYLARAERLRLGLNVGLLAGHNTIRRVVMGSDNRAPTADELDQMRAMTARAMGEGAFGLSTGLEYVPGAYSETDEIIGLARVAADSGGIYTSHMRDEARGLMASVRELLRIGREARIPVVITHAKAIGRPRWGVAVNEMLAAVDSARAAGTDVMMDQYPYTASHTTIGILVPPWALAGGDTAFRRRLNDAALRDSIVAGIIERIVAERGGDDLEFAQFSRVPWDRRLEGRTLADWARRRGREPSPRVGADLVIEALLNGGAQAVYHVMHEDDVRRIMRHPLTMIASDARPNRLGDGHPHPRAYGTFPRVLGRYVRDDSVLTLEQAVHKMTGLPARRLNLADRGRIAVGAAADLVVFDPATIADRATFTWPHQYPVGIRWVVVNGVITLGPSGLTGQRGGAVLRRPPR